MSIISCYRGFRLESTPIQKYKTLISKSLQGAGQLNIHMTGITASNSCIMIQGFPQEPALEKIRNNLRQNFKNSGLNHSIDKRYRLRTAHSTVVRFSREISKRTSFLNTLYLYKNFDFGSFTVKDVELVYNDWYQRKRNKKVIEIYTFKEP